MPNSIKDTIIPPSADITRKERAVALQYQGLDQVPTVLAAGRGAAARAITALARQHGIPVQQNETLAELLGNLPSGEPISPESFRLVAELLCFLYSTDERWRSQHDFLDPVLGELPMDSVTNNTEH